MFTGFVLLILLAAAVLFIAHQRGWLTDRTLAGLGAIAAILSVLLALKQDLRSTELTRSAPSRNERSAGSLSQAGQEAAAAAMQPGPQQVEPHSPLVESYPPTPPAEYPSDDPRFVQTSSVMQLRVSACRAGDMIVCEFVLTNTGEDRSIAIQRPQPLMVGETRVIDDAGREFTAKRLRLANKENPSRIHTHAVKGVPMQLQITFAPGAQASKEVKLLEVDGWDDGIASRLAFQFRDLPLLK